MEIGVTAFRADMKIWLDRVKAGEELIITDRGVPVARLVGITATPVLERLEREGVIRLPRSSSRHSASKRRRVSATQSVSELVSQQRD